MRIPFFGARVRAARSRRAAKPTFQPRLESLEERITPYVASGGAWVNPQLITISFMPDGTLLGYNGQGQPIYSSLFQNFSSLGSVSTWENQILKGAQVWAQQTNINFSIVSDDGSAAGSGNYEQGASNFGDIRIGGFQEGSGSSYPLAYTYMPPQLNNYSVAGDVTFNTSQPFNIGSTYDLFTVAAHEMGHALGLSESNNANAIMYSQYTGTFSGLNTDDINGIQDIYSNNGPRTMESASNGSFATATNVSINTSTFTAQEYADVTTITTNNYYEFTAPTGSASTATISVQSAGLSLLSPKLYVYNSSHTQIGYVNGVGQDGTTLTVTANITPGSLYYVKVMGADSTAFSTGDYALTINTGTGASPAVTIPNTQVLNGTPLQGYGGEDEVIGQENAALADRSFNFGAKAPAIMNAAASQVDLTQHAMILIPGMEVAEFAYQPNGNVQRLTDSVPALNVRPDPGVAETDGSDFDDLVATDDDGTVLAMLGE